MPAPTPAAVADDVVVRAMPTGRRAARRAADRAAGGPGWRGGWTALGIGALSRSLLLSVAVLLLWAVAPELWGWQSTAVMTGSMQPRLVPGDVAVARPVAPQELQIGQVLLVDDPDHAGRLRLHRLVDVTDGQLVLRGDANPAADSSPVGFDAVRGVAVLRVPFAASPVLAWTSGDRRPALLAAGGLALLAAGALVPRVAAGPPDPPGRGRTRRPRGRHRAAPVRGRLRGPRVLAAAAACAAAVALLPTAQAEAAFRVTTASPTSGWTATPYFSCVNAGYDGTAAAPGTGRALRSYALQEASGTTATNTGSQASANGTYVGTPSPTTSGPACGAGGTRAVTFNGTSQYVNTTAAVGSLTGTTVAVWFRTTDSNGGRLVGLGDSNRTSGQTASATSDRTLFLTAAGNVAFGTLASGTARTLLSPGTYRDGAWHLATGVASPTGTALFVDGQQVATGTAASATTASLYVRLAWDSLAGWPSAPANTFFAGSLAHASLYPTALSASQVQAHWRAGA